MTTTFLDEYATARKSAIEKGEARYASLKEQEQQYMDRLGELTGTLERVGVNDTEAFLSQFPTKGSSLKERMIAFATEQGESGVTMNELAAQFKDQPQHNVFKIASNLIDGKMLKETKLERNSQVVFILAKAKTK